MQRIVDQQTREEIRAGGAGALVCTGLTAAVFGALIGAVTGFAVGGLQGAYTGALVGAAPGVISVAHTGMMAVNVATGYRGGSRGGSRSAHRKSRRLRQRGGAESCIVIKHPDGSTTETSSSLPVELLAAVVNKTRGVTDTTEIAKIVSDLVVESNKKNSVGGRRSRSRRHRA